MTRTLQITLSLAALAATAGLAAHPAGASTLCVGAGGGCYASIQAAVNAAHTGDTIAIGRGTFAGGVHITKNVDLVGRGARRTTIEGGSSVITIGRFGSGHEPTVSISGVTVTGGLVHDGPESVPFTGVPGTFAGGGGIEIPPNADFTGGATVTIRHSVISGNRAEPTATAPVGPPCPSGPCPFGSAAGGGIDSWGRLTVIDSVVEDNLAQGLSDADGAGIASWLDDLTLRHTTVRNNRALAEAPISRFAEGGGLFVENGGVSMHDVWFTGNVARMTTRLPAFADPDDLIEVNANGGGVHISHGTRVIVDHAVVTHNTVTAIGRRAEACAFDAGFLNNDAPMTMRDTVVSHNRVTDITATLADVGPCGGAIDSDGGRTTISRLEVVGNVMVSRSRHGAALAAGAFSVLGSAEHAFRRVTLTHSIVRGNVLIARSRTGFAGTFGAGVFSNALLTMKHVSVDGNRNRSVGAQGIEQGAGIWSGPLLTGPPVQLTVLDSSVTDNVLVRAAGVLRQGGGLFTNAPHRIRRTAFSGNVPGDCFGCGGGLPASSTRSMSSFSVRRASSTDAVWSRVMRARGR
jgi:hypothetical protein